MKHKQGHDAIFTMRPQVVLYRYDMLHPIKNNLEIVHPIHQLQHNCRNYKNQLAIRRFLFDFGNILVWEKKTKVISFRSMLKIHGQ